MKNQKKNFDLSNLKIDDFDILTISIYLSDNLNEIESFNIGNNLITSEGLIYLLEGLQWHTNLKELYLSYFFGNPYNFFFLGNNNFEEIGLNATIETLSSFNNLTYLGYFFFY